MKKTKKMEGEKKKGHLQIFLRFFCLHTQNPRRFPGFAVVVVTFFDVIFDDIHFFFRNMFFVKEINNEFLGVSMFPGKSDTFCWTWNKTQILPTKINDKIR